MVTLTLPNGGTFVPLFLGAYFNLRNLLYIIEIAKVFLTACREVGKNVGETAVEAVKEEIVEPMINAVLAAAKDRISYNDNDTTAFGLTKMGIGGYVGSVVGVVTGNPLLGTQTALNAAKYLNENPFTISVGGQFSVAAGGATDCGIMATLDSNGYVAVQHFDNLGGGSPNASVGGLLMITNAPSYADLAQEIPAMNFGGSYSAGLSVGGDHVVTPGGLAEQGYYSGLSVSVGIGSSLLPPIPAEIHAVASETETLAAWNLN